MWFGVWGKGLDVYFCPTVPWEYQDEKYYSVMLSKNTWIKDQNCTYALNIVVSPVAPSTADCRTSP